MRNPRNILDSGNVAKIVQNYDFWWRTACSTRDTIEVVPGGPFKVVAYHGNRSMWQKLTIFGINRNTTLTLISMSPHMAKGYDFLLFE
jgi:hypothetical protein